jgi:hypothetical protein
MPCLPLINRVTKSANPVAVVVTAVMAIALRVVLALVLAPVLAMLPLLMAATSPLKQQTL